MSNVINFPSFQQQPDGVEHLVVSCAPPATKSEMFVGLKESRRHLRYFVHHIDAEGCEADEWLYVGKSRVEAFASAARRGLPVIDQTGDDHD